MQEILLKVRYFERGLSKTLKKSTLFFLRKSVPFQKQKEHGTSAQSLFMLGKKSRKIPLLVISYLTKFDDTMIKTAIARKKFFLK